MEKVYITQSKLESIARNLEYGRFDKDDLCHFFEQRFLKSFSHKELKTLSAIKHVLESMQDEDLSFTLINQLNEDQSKVKHSVGSQNLVYQASSAPAFHSDDQCPSLLKDYENFRIPVEIPEYRYEEFRVFFKQNRSLYAERRYVFFMRAELAFGVKILDIQEIHEPNSGTATLHACQKMSTAHEMIQEIDDLAVAMDAYRHKDDYTSKVVEKITFAEKTPKKFHQFSNDLEILNQWSQYKKSMRDLIIEHIYSIYAPDRRLSRHALTELGFKPCSYCQSGTHKTDWSRYATTDA